MTLHEVQPLLPSASRTFYPHMKMLPPPPAPVYHHSPSCLYGVGYSWSFWEWSHQHLFLCVSYFTQLGIFRCPKECTQGSCSIVCTLIHHPSFIEGHRVTLPSWLLEMSSGEVSLPTVQLSAGPFLQPFMVCILKMELLAHVVMVKFWDHLDFSLLTSSKRKKKRLSVSRFIKSCFRFHGLCSKWNAAS